MLTKQQKKEARDTYISLSYSMGTRNLRAARASNKLASIWDGCDPLRVKALMKKEDPDIVLWFAKQRRLLQWYPRLDCLIELYPG